jgi:hypothetical protein
MPINSECWMISVSELFPYMWTNNVPLYIPRLLVIAVPYREHKVLSRSIRQW